jgi:hypothetical protein
MANERWYVGRSGRTNLKVWHAIFFAGWDRKVKGFSSAARDSMAFV